MRSFHFTSLVRLIATLSSWPLDWARGLLQHQAAAQRQARERLLAPPPAFAAGVADMVGAWHASGVAAGFDLARTHYAAAVQAGLIERSLLASGAFERRLGLLEHLTLGPRARSV